MKKLSTLQLVPGMILAQNVLNIDGHHIMTKNTALTDKLITKLTLYGVLTVYVEDTVPYSQTISSAPREPSYSDHIKSTPEFQHFKKVYELNVDSFRDSLCNVVKRNLELDVDILLTGALEIVSSAAGQMGVLDMLQNMREYDDSTYAHCMNVALICNLLSTWLKMTPAQTELATACGLFHDIGKIEVPHNIIAKPGKLSEDEYLEIQKHPTAGYQILHAQNVNIHIQNAALMHHERNDASGYPGRLCGNQIDPYASMVAIADVYDAMTAARVYRGPLCPFRVIEIFEQEGFQRYDVEYLLVFLENVVSSYIRNRCRLSDGREGDIIYINKNYLSRPIVQCGTQYINLAERTDLFITDLL